MEHSRLHLYSQLIACLMALPKLFGGAPPTEWHETECALLFLGYF